MISMSTFVSIIVPVSLTAVVFLLPKIRSWAERKRTESEARAQFVEQFHTEAMNFLKLTDAKSDQRTRRIAIGAANQMMDGTKLIRMMLRPSENKHSKQARSSMKASMKALPIEAQHSLAKLIALALLVSSFNSPFLGGLYRSMLNLMLTRSNGEVEASEQVVVRLSRQPKLESSPAMC